MGVLVLGMHRSGTSAVASILESAGLALGAHDEMVPPAADNPEGFYELRSAVEIDEEVLAKLGGAWDYPPVDAPENWALTPEFALEAERIRELVDDVLGGRPFAVKDPRLSLVVPLWRRALLDRFSVVLVVRDPLEVAWSLALRDGMPVLTGLGLWLRYNREILRSIGGLPVEVVSYDALTSDPAGTVDAVLASLIAFGQLEGEIDSSLVAGRVRGDLRRTTMPLEKAEFRDVPVEVTAMSELLGSLVGRHDCFACPTVPEESWWEGPLFEERRRAATAIGRLEAQHKSARERDRLHEVELERHDEEHAILRQQLLDADDQLALERDHIARLTAELDRLKATWPFRVRRSLGRLVGR